MILPGKTARTTRFRYLRIVKFGRLTVDYHTRQNYQYYSYQPLFCPDIIKYIKGEYDCKYQLLTNILVNKTNKTNKTRTYITGTLVGCFATA